MNTGAELRQYFCANTCTIKKFHILNGVEPPNRHSGYDSAFYGFTLSRLQEIRESNCDKMRSSVCALGLLLKFKIYHKNSYLTPNGISVV